MLYRVTADGENPFPEVERRMEQNDRVLRYLTVRLDKGRLRERASKAEPAAAAEAEAADAGATPAKGSET